MSLYLWQMGGSALQLSAFAALACTPGIVLGLMGSLESGREAINECTIATEMLLSVKETRDEEQISSNGGTVAVGAGLCSCVISLLLALNLQGVAGGAAATFDSGGFVFSLASVGILGVMLESLSCGFQFWSATMLPVGSPMLLAAFIVSMEVASGVIRCFTLGVRLLANMLVGQILLFMWINSWAHISRVGSSFCVGSLCVKLLKWSLVYGGTALFSLAFCYESFVYFFQSFLYGLLLLFYLDDSRHNNKIIMSPR